ncbi:MAG TPA: Holliday junction branch migration protein RuvA [Candidatus Blautia gallistercoris]|uniref:Holliday junction branch migration complex subunit RuvA n=1 Tax=Candidatus Blautia gallistercoris TaxID=2838490 RepID=A0A9D1WHA7_9FIRM|nr:Holliday junction branch migration protein RuvA [Candidatus Blautia gallistercoris]
MIAYIKGEVTELSVGRLVLENQGLGYELQVSAGDLEELHIGQTVKIYTYVQLLEREGTFQSFGFLRKDSLEVFRMLLGVSGIGPKAALGILSGLGADTLRFAVLSDDVKTIAKAPGIGRKTAQKLILELKDKFSLEEAFEKKLETVQAQEETAKTPAAQEAVEALTALGYSPADALRAVKKADTGEDMDVEQLLKASLKYM